MGKPIGEIEIATSPYLPGKSWNQDHDETRLEQQHTTAHATT